MGGKSVHLRLSEKLHRQLLNIKQKLGFSSVQEIIKEVTRNSVSKYNKKFKK